MKYYVEFANGKCRVVHPYKNKDGFYYVEDGKRHRTRLPVKRGAKKSPPCFNKRAGPGRPPKTSARGSRSPRRRRKSRSKSPKRKSRSKSRCSRRTQARYTSRPGPPYAAKTCKGKNRKGNNGRMYKSTRIKTKDGKYQWRWHLV